MVHGTHGTTGRRMADPTVNKDEREAFRETEEHTLDLMAQILTSEHWAELLKAAFKRGAVAPPRKRQHRPRAETGREAPVEILSRSEPAAWAGMPELSNLNFQSTSWETGAGKLIRNKKLLVCNCCAAGSSGCRFDNGFCSCPDLV